MSSFPRGGPPHSPDGRRDAARSFKGAHLLRDSRCCLGMPCSPAALCSPSSWGALVKVPSSQAVWGSVLPAASGLAGAACLTFGIGSRAVSVSRMSESAVKHIRAYVEMTLRQPLKGKRKENTTKQDRRTPSCPQLPPPGRTWVAGRGPVPGCKQLVAGTWLHCHGQTGCSPES